MRDRLTQLIHDAHMAIANRDDNRDTYTAIADYLLDNGVIVPPIKLGRTVYDIDFRKQIRECRVSMITQKANGEFKVRLSSRGRCSGDYTEDELERYVFLTREAAEEALKTREQNAD